MSFGKLLGAGKSFMSGHNTAAYRADKRAYLPKFVSPKNPFANSVMMATQAELPKAPPENTFAASKKKNAVAAWVKRRKNTSVCSPRRRYGAGDELDKQS